MYLQTLVSDPEHTCSPTERKSNRRYQLEVIGSAAVYTVLLLISIHFVDRITPGAAKTAVALLPMIGVVGMSLAMVRFTMRADELQRQTMLISGAISAVATAVITMCFGFLENAGMAALPITFVWPMIVLIFGICVPIVRRRYR